MLKGGYEFRPHQVTTIKSGLTVPRFSDWSDTGTGKTLPALAILIKRMAAQYVTKKGSLERHREKRHAAIICPASAMLGWEEHFEIVDAPGVAFFSYYGTVEKRRTLRRIIEKTMQTKQCVILMSWGILSNVHCEVDWQWIVDVVKPHYLLMDEVQYVNNSMSSRGIKIQQYVDYPKVEDDFIQIIMMSATPQSNGPEKAWDLFHLQHRDILTGANRFYVDGNTSFLRRHFPKHTYDKGRLLAGKLVDVEYYQKVFASNSIKHTREDVFDNRAEPSHTVVRYSLNPKHAAIYENYLRILEEEAERRKIFMSEALFAKAIRERQLATDPSMLDLPDVSDKFDLLLEELQSYEVGTKNKALVLVEFVHTFNRLLERLGKAGYGCAGIVGAYSKKKREQEIIRFREDPKCSVFIGMRKAMAEGVNLQAANISVNYELGWELDKYLQGLGRTDRLGQTKQLHYVNFVARHTIDVRIWLKIREKLNIKKEIESSVIQNTRSKISADLAAKLRKLATEELNEIEGAA